MAGTYTSLWYHLVFSTKNRTPSIQDTWKSDLHSYLGGIVRAEKGIALEIGGMPDHVHLLVQLKATHSLSDFMRILKSNSSKWINETKCKLRKFGWQDGFSAFSVSPSQIDRVRQYIATQEEHHQTRDYQAELIALLKKHAISYDELYIWK
jgi:putative transposase